MNCQRCQSERLVRIGAKCADRCSTIMLSRKIVWGDGYAPCIPNVTGSEEDYISFTACLECGQLQGKFPVPNPRKG